MEYVKKQRLGQIKACASEKATHVLQTKEEYSEMIGIASMYRDKMQKSEAREKTAQEKVSTLQSENSRLREDTSSLRSENMQLSQTTVKVTALEQEKEDLQKRVSELEEAAIQGEGLNRNLLRIMRERANAERHISPKKQHDGFIVLQSREWRERLPNKNILRTWKSIIQTPFDASMELRYVEKQIFEALTECVLADISCTRYVLPEDNGRCVCSEDGENVLYSWRFCADFRSGYWNAIIYTTLPLVVPLERRARHQRENRKTVSISAKK